MSTQNYESYVLFPRRQYAGLNRSTIIIAFCAILGLVGSLTLSVAFSSTGSRASSSSSTGTTSYTTTQWSLAHAVAATPQSQPTSVAHAVTATPQSQPTSVTATPAQSNTDSSSSNSPITPFPTLLWQEIAALQAQNRFLYYGNQSVPEVALTFDDGPNPYYNSMVSKQPSSVLDDKSRSTHRLSSKSITLAMSLATIPGRILT